MSILPIYSGMNFTYNKNSKPNKINSNIRTSHQSFAGNPSRKYESAEARAEREYFENIRKAQEERARFDAFNRKVHYARDHGLDPACLDIRDFYEKPEPIDYDDCEALGELYDDSCDDI